MAAVRAQVMHAAQWQTGLARARDESRLSDQQWWTLYGPRLALAMAGEELPVSSRVGQSVASAGDPEATWRFMVDRLISALSVALPGNGR